MDNTTSQLVFFGGSLDFEAFVRLKARTLIRGFAEGPKRGTNPN